MAAHLAAVPDLPAVEALSEEVAVLHDQLAGAEKEIRAWRARYSNLKRDREAEAQADPLWPLSERVFVYWQRVLDHPRAEWSWKRFELARPYLSGRNYGLEACLRAIVGRRAQDWYVRHGRTMWEDIFRDQGVFESCRDACPVDWCLPAGAVACLERANPASRRT